MAIGRAHDVAGPPLVWRLVNALRAWCENRRTPEATYLQQVAAVWTAPVIRERKVA